MTLETFSKVSWDRKSSHATNDPVKETPDTDEESESVRDNLSMGSSISSFDVHSSTKIRPIQLSVADDLSGVDLKAPISEDVESKSDTESTSSGSSSDTTSEAEESAEISVKSGTTYEQKEATEKSIESVAKAISTEESELVGIDLSENEEDASEEVSNAQEGKGSRGNDDHSPVESTKKPELATIEGATGKPNLPPLGFTRSQSNTSAIRRKMKDSLRITALLPRSRSIPVKDEAAESLSMPKPFGLRKLSGLRKQRSDVSVPRSIGSRSIGSRFSSKKRNASLAGSKAGTKDGSVTTASAVTQSYASKSSSKKGSGSVASKASSRSESIAIASATTQSVASKASSKKGASSVASKASRRSESVAMASAATPSVASKASSKRGAGSVASQSAASRASTKEKAAAKIVGSFSSGSFSSKPSSNDTEKEDSSFQDSVTEVLSKDSSAGFSDEDSQAGNADIIVNQSTGLFTDDASHPYDENEDADIISKQSSTPFTEDGSTTGISQKASKTNMKMPRGEEIDLSEDVFSGLGDEEKTGPNVETGAQDKTETETKPHVIPDEIQDPWPNPWSDTDEQLERQKDFKLYPNKVTDEVIDRVIGTVANESQSTEDTSLAGNVKRERSLTGDSPVEHITVDPASREAHRLLHEQVCKDIEQQTFTLRSLSATDKELSIFEEAAPTAKTKSEVEEASPSAEIKSEVEEASPAPETKSEVEEASPAPETKSEAERKPSVWKRTKQLLKSNKKVVDSSAGNRAVESGTSSSKTAKVKMGYLCLLGPCARRSAVSEMQGTKKRDSADRGLDANGLPVIPGGQTHSEEEEEGSEKPKERDLLKMIQILDHNDSNDDLIIELLDDSMSESPYSPVDAYSFADGAGDPLATLSSGTYGDELMMVHSEGEPSLMGSINSYVLAAQDALQNNMFACNFGGCGGGGESETISGSRAITKTSGGDDDDEATVKAGNPFSRVFGELVDVLECSPGQQAAATTA